MALKLRTVVSAASLLGLMACTDINTTTDLNANANLTTSTNLATNFVTADKAAPDAISAERVIAAQEQWGQGIVDISRVHSEGGDFRARAEEHIDTLYGYDLGLVMFKPTLAAEDQFRETFEQALSYFIGTEGSEDSGFAIKGWTDVRWADTQVYTDADSAMAMGNYFFTGPDGSETQAEYSFGYVLSESGALKINLHHSSLPYDPGPPGPQGD